MIDSIKVRMYRQGFGDCFLLRYFSAEEMVFSMLIDCGLKLNDHVEGITLKDVANDIKSLLVQDSKVKLDVLVATHEHWDHVSGFSPKDKLFDDFDIDEIWLAWTENPDDPEASLINTRLKKNIVALKLATEHLSNNNSKEVAQMAELVGAKGLSLARSKFNETLESILGFQGDIAFKTPGGISVPGNIDISIATEDAMKHIRTLAGENGTLRYFDPGTIIEEDGLPGIRIYVLGPPKNGLLNKDKPSSGVGKEVYFGSDPSIAGFVDGILGFGADSHRAEGRPFGDAVASIDPKKAESIDFYKKTYFQPEESWRSIEFDWLDMAGALALQMDTDTNNTSLALAIEFTKSKKVLLFPGDAQVGNWLSWHNYTWQVLNGSQTENIQAEQLLNRTVLYKVGHHASHNATLKEKGLELMTHPDLIALIPEKEKQYNGIPYQPLLDTLKAKTKGRMVFSADRLHPAENVTKIKPGTLTNKQWETFKENLTVDRLFIEYKVTL